MSKKLAYLALADGTVFSGEGFGADRGIDNPIVGEVVFNTAMSGYQEVLTDPSYAGQIMCFTAPQIGNVGCNPEDYESNKMWAEGLICRESSQRVSNFRATESLSDFLVREGKLGLSGIDTRKLVSHLRDNGAQMGAIAICSEGELPKLIKVAKDAGSMEGKEYVSHVAVKSGYRWDKPIASIAHISFNNKDQVRSSGDRPLVVALDCGVKRSILSLLVEAGFDVQVVPAFSSAKEILSYNPQGVFLSNGPGDPATLKGIVSATTDLLGQVPIFGICLGHQILGQAIGGKTFKLKFGHRGGNHPVKNLITGKIDITVQNHGFAVDADSLPSQARVTHINLNDGTVEGLEVPSADAFSVQYHPEASPGPHDALPLFTQFYSLVRSRSYAKAS